MDLIPLVVQSRCAEAADIISLELVPEHGETLPEFWPGAHIDLRLGNGMIRSYSLINSPAERSRYRIAVLKDPRSRGGSRFVHEELQVGTRLESSPPRNNFTLDEKAAKTVLLAGGIGVTPLLCMFTRLRSLDKSVELIYCSRSKACAAFLDELSAMGGQIRTHFDDGHGGPPDLNSLFASYDAETHFYCCGPSAMIAAFEDSCDRHGYRNVHIERFVAEDHQAAQGASFEVVLAKSGRTILVPAGKSILDTLQEAGVPADSSCHEGVCGVCEAVVLEGIPDHRDSVLTERERSTNKKMMICVSGCKGSRLVLSL